MIKKVLVADEHFLVREGIGVSIQSVFDYVALFYAGSSHDLNAQIASQDFDLIILDVRMTEMDRYFLKTIRAKMPNVKILIFSDLANEKAAAYIQQGVEGFLHKSCGKDQLLDALKALSEDKYYFSGELIKVLLFQTASKTPRMLLSDREFEIFILLADGYGNLEICNRLDLKSGTVSTYKRRILKKLNIKTIADLVKMQMASDDY